ncbi:UNVERIFIED_CONTAM: hypothetical protein GTU68_008454 [Idotea baltica]|nr:hypothetical protein [Idotea baltica]
MSALLSPRQWMSQE